MHFVEVQGRGGKTASG